MATGLESVATLVSIIGFSAQIFDGCVKGFVLLSSARNLGRDADILRSMLDWEQFRLEKWAEKANISDPSKADMLMDWKLVSATLEHIENLTNDANVLKQEYNLVLVEKAPTNEKTPPGSSADQSSVSRFKRLFGQSEKSSTAAAKVIQRKNNAPRKLWWAAVDKENLKHLVDDLSHFVQRLYDILNSSIQTQMQQSLEKLLQDATNRQESVLDLEFLRELAARKRYDCPGYDEAEAKQTAAGIEKKFTGRLFSSVAKGEIEQVNLLLEKGVDVHATDFCGWSPMIRAAEAGQLAVVELLLRRGADPLGGTIGHRLPLHFAAENGHERVVRLLLTLPGADSNAKEHQGQTPLFKAASNGHVSIVELLLKQKEIEPDAPSNDGFTPLLQAIIRSHSPIVHLLLSRSDVNPNQCDLSYKQTPLWMAVMHGNEIVKMLLKRDDIEVDGQSRWGETPLYQAIQRSRLSVAQMLLDVGADPNIPNWQEQTPLSFAAAEGSEEAIEMLLKQPRIALDVPDSLAQTPPMRAANHGHSKTIKLLLTKGANVSCTDFKGRTALSLAAEKGHKIAAKFLLKSKADINVQDKNGKTPLALAVENKHDVVVRFLLESGADAEIADEDGETPLEKAKDEHLDQVVQIFKELLQL
ncbi:hypothetical protein MMC28_011138 [Mycoblastus sanguinarius]|nr:hypothetical protein [Mycoblastus sanguinarius]